MTAASLRVVHIPARAPYARKLTAPDLVVLNGQALSTGAVVPRDATVRWLLDLRPFTWFDALHLHHLEFEDVDVLRQVLDECGHSRRAVVFTAHDIDPVFIDPTAYRRRLDMLAERAVPFVCLTARGQEAVIRRLGTGVRTVVVPHGYVAPPETWPNRLPRASDQPRYMVLGSLRRSRDIETVLHCWRFGRRQRATTLTLLLRAPGPATLRDEDSAWRVVAAFAADPRLRVEMAPFPTDDEVIQAGSAADALLLPYRWASHSGQLELAFDLGLLPVASRIGYLADQFEMHRPLVGEPVWFDWSDGEEYAYGERFLGALDQARDLLSGGWVAPDRERFREHRIGEHELILRAYRELYAEPTAL